MERLKSFIKTSLLGGVTIILPVAILLGVFGWLFNFVTGLIQPLTNIITAKADVREVIADILVILIILAVCFAVGVLVKTSVGRFFHRLIEERFLRIAPGYNLIKETIIQLLGGQKAPFSKVALVQLFENDTLVTAFVTDEHDDGSFTVFVPTGPNPTSGFVYHVPGKCVHTINVPIEDAMRSTISCGAGSSRLITEYQKKIKSQNEII